MTRNEINIIGKLLIDHYSLKGSISDTEVKDEIRMLARKHGKGSLDDRGQRIAARIHVATGRDVVELHSSYKH